MFEDKHLKSDLAYLIVIFVFSPKQITNLEKSTLFFDEGLNIISDVKYKLFKCDGIVAELVKN